MLFEALGLFVMIAVACTFKFAPEEKELRRKWIVLCLSATISEAVVAAFCADYLMNYSNNAVLIKLCFGIPITSIIVTAGYFGLYCSALDNKKA